MYFSAPRASLTAFASPFFLLIFAVTSAIASEVTSSADVSWGAYLAQIGVCEACHTPPAAASDTSTNCMSAADLAARTHPDWFAHLSTNLKMAGGVPFIIRLNASVSGVVRSSNITPDLDTGIGRWSIEEIEEAIRWGRRPDGSELFRFAPHTFFEKLADDDVRALAAYLKSVPPIKNEVLPRDSTLSGFAATPSTTLATAPSGRTRARAEYLMDALVGCKECHSYHDQHGNLVPFVGGDPSDPYVGVFRMGPDLPIRQEERGLAAFPYPGFAVLYGGNLTRFGTNGDLQATPVSKIVEALQLGLSTQPDQYGRPIPLSHVMMWQFYKDMSSDDAGAIADYLKSLPYTPHDIGPRLRLFGTDSIAAFRQAFGSEPSQNDRHAFNLGTQSAPVCR